MGTRVDDFLPLRNTAFKELSPPLHFETFADFQHVATGRFRELV